MTTEAISDVPIGTIVMWGGPRNAGLADSVNILPPGWLLCDGAEVSIAGYSELYGVIGGRYGTATSATTFVLPDFVPASTTTLRVPGGAAAGVLELGATQVALSNAVTTQGSVVGVNFIIKAA